MIKSIGVMGSIIPRARGNAVAFAKDRIFYSIFTPSVLTMLSSSNEVWQMDVIFLLVLLALLVGSIGLVQLLARLGDRKSGERP